MYDPWAKKLTKLANIPPAIRGEDDMYDLAFYPYETSFSNASGVQVFPFNHDGTSTGNPLKTNIVFNVNYGSTTNRYASGVTQVAYSSVSWVKGDKGLWAYEKPDVTGGRFEVFYSELPVTGTKYNAVAHLHLKHYPSTATSSVGNLICAICRDPSGLSSFLKAYTEPKEVKTYQIDFTQSQFDADFSTNSFDQLVDTKNSPDHGGHLHSHDASTVINKLLLDTYVIDPNVVTIISTNATGSIGDPCVKLVGTYSGTTFTVLQVIVIPYGG